MDKFSKEAIRQYLQVGWELTADYDLFNDDKIDYFHNEYHVMQVLYEFRLIRIASKKGFIKFPESMHVVHYFVDFFNEI